MNRFIIIFLLIAAQAAFADSLPLFSLQPANQTVVPGTTATFTASATGATSYQWRFNGTDVPGATSATLQVNNAQTTNSGYYNVIAKNATGWVPSQMAWLAVVFSKGTVRFSNLANTGAWGQAVSQITGQPIDGSAQVLAGPALDEMQLIAGSGNKARVTNGWFSGTTISVPTVESGQTAYYAVYITYTNSSITYTQQSTVISLTTGGNGFPVPSPAALRFPYWIEWPEPLFQLYYSTTRNPVCIPGETVLFTNQYIAYADFGMPYGQWHKDGQLIPGATNYIDSFPSPPGYGSVNALLALTNLQPADAGVYDFVLYGNNWIIGPPITLSIQTTNGQGVFQNPRFAGTNFVSDLLGAASRNYKVQQSLNLLSWSDLVTLSNLSGTVTFTNPPATGPIFYRTALLP